MTELELEQLLRSHDEEYSYTKSASITPFLPEVLSFFCHLPSALSPPCKGVVNKGFDINCYICTSSGVNPNSALTEVKDLSQYSSKRTPSKNFAFFPSSCPLPRLVKISFTCWGAKIG
jgi:hypothetical protein